MRHLIKKFPDHRRKFPDFSLTFPGLQNSLTIPGFQGFPGLWEPFYSREVEMQYLRL